MTLPAPTATPGAAPTVPAATVVPGEPVVPAVAAPTNDPIGGPEPKVASQWDDETRAYIKTLRTENADRRKSGKDLQDRLTNLETEGNEFRSNVAKALGIESNLSPEDQISHLTDTTHDLQSQNFMLQTMVENGIGKEDSNYFQFLLTQKASELSENQELSEEDLQGIIAEVNARKVAPINTTSINTQNPGGKAPAPGVPTDMTAEQFAKMNISEKSHLFATKPEIYNVLMAEVKEKRLLI